MLSVSCEDHARAPFSSGEGGERSGTDCLDVRFASTESSWRRKVLRLKFGNETKRSFSLQYIDRVLEFHSTPPHPPQLFFFPSLPFGHFVPSSSFPSLLFSFPHSILSFVSSCIVLRIMTCSCFRSSEGGKRRGDIASRSLVSDFFLSRGNPIPTKLRKPNKLLISAQFREVKSSQQNPSLPPPALLLPSARRPLL